MLTFYGTGMILGAGIYSIIGKAAGVAGETLWMGFVLASLAALLTAFSYAELSTMFPKAGAEYVYLSHTFKQKKWIATTIGTAMAFSGAATAATVALAFSGYLNQFIEGSGLLVAAALLMVFTGVAILGIRGSGWTNIVFTLIEISGLLLIIYLGMKNETFGKALSAIPHQGTFAGAALIIFSYFGFENIVNLAEEAKEPHKKLPQAIFLSLGISTLLYILVSLAAVALLSPESLAQSEAPLMSAAQKTSSKIASILGGIALFSTANTALISLIGASRVLYGMASAKALPQIMSRTLPQRKTPWIASIVILAAALLLLPVAKVETVASISSLTTIVAFISVNISLVVLRFTDEKKERPFRVPLCLGKFPILPFFGILVSIAFLFQFNRLVYAIGGSFLLATLLIFYIRDRFYR